MEEIKKLARNERRDELLKELEEGLNVSKKIVKGREKLPIYEKKDEILKMIRENKVVLIKGETGCGKTTQVPQYILEDRVKSNLGSVTNILVTQPRRISAVSVANRVAEERGENIDEGSRQDRTVGYEIRFESMRPRDVASITFCTTGVVLQKLRQDPTLSSVSHLVIDEVHERDLFTDILMGVVKTIQRKQDMSLKVVIMSANLEIETFKNYFHCPLVEASGRCFEVERIYLEDFIQRFSIQDQFMNMQSLTRAMMNQLGAQNRYVERYGQLGDKIFQFERSETIDTTFVTDLILDIHQTHKDIGSILVFLPGWDEISDIHYYLTNEYLDYHQSKDNKWYLDDANVFMLHSQVDMTKQVKVFRPPQDGKRKIILSTNIAETSVTIEDVVYVIDCGKMNVSRYNGLQKASNLTLEWVAQSNGDQRSGRAGRIQPGKCWHLYSRLRQESLKECMDPEIKRSPMEDVILQIKSLNLHIDRIEEFTLRLLDQPFNTSIKDGILLLEQIGALEPGTQRLTTLGRELANIPLHPQLGKMVLNAVFFRCLDPILSIVAVLSEKDPFQLQNKRKRDQLDEKRARFAKGKPSDHQMFANTINQWEKACNSGTSDRFCSNHCLNTRILDGIYKTKMQIKERLRTMGHLGDERTLEAHSMNDDVVLGVLASGLYPLIKVAGWNATRAGSFPFLQDDDNKRIYINQKSVNANKRFIKPYVGFFLARGNKKGNLSAQDCTNFDAQIVKLFTPIGGSEHGNFGVARKIMDNYVDQCLRKNPVATSNSKAIIYIIGFLASIKS